MKTPEETYWTIRHPGTGQEMEVRSFEYAMEHWFEGFNCPILYILGESEPFEQSYKRVKDYLSRPRKRKMKTPEEEREKLMKLLKPLKITSFVVTVVSCAYGMNVAYAYLSKELNLLKRELVAQVIDEDLKGKDLTIDIKDKKSKPGNTLTPDELRKALWVLSIQNDQLKHALNTVKSAIDYHEGK